MASRFQRRSTALRALPRATPSRKQRCAGLMGLSLRRAFAWRPYATKESKEFKAGDISDAKGLPVFSDSVDCALEFVTASARSKRPGNHGRGESGEMEQWPADKKSLCRKKIGSRTTPRPLGDLECSGRGRGSG